MTVSSLPQRSGPLGTAVVAAAVTVLASVVLTALVLAGSTQNADAQPQRQRPCVNGVWTQAQLASNPNGDWDGDGVTNISEAQNGSLPCTLPCHHLLVIDIRLNPRGDWDGDGVDNMSEYNNSYNPCAFNDYTIVPSGRSRPVVVTATAVPQPTAIPPTPVPPRPTAVPATPVPATPVPATPVPATATPLPVRIVPVPTETAVGDSQASESSDSESADIKQARELLERWDSGDYDDLPGPTATTRAQPSPAPEPTATVETLPSPAPEPTATGDADTDTDTDAGAVADSGASDDPPRAADANEVADTSGPVERAEQPVEPVAEGTEIGVIINDDLACGGGVGVDGQCLRWSHMFFVVAGAAAIVGSAVMYERRRNIPQHPSLKLFP